jgi:hypothetical protein
VVNHFPIIGTILVWEYYQPIVIKKIILKHTALRIISCWLICIEYKLLERREEMVEDMSKYGVQNYS